MSQSDLTALLSQKSWVPIKPKPEFFFRFFRLILQLLKFFVYLPWSMSPVTDYLANTLWLIISLTLYLLNSSNWKRNDSWISKKTFTINWTEKITSSRLADGQPSLRFSILILPLTLPLKWISKPMPSNLRAPVFFVTEWVVAHGPKNDYPHISLKDNPRWLNKRGIIFLLRSNFVFQKIRKNCATWRPLQIWRTSVADISDLCSINVNCPWTCDPENASWTFRFFCGGIKRIK